MSDSLTPIEEKVYQYLIQFLAANSYQPSIREIGRQFDIKSTKTVSDVLGNLARKGYIQRNQARSRGLRILGAHSGATQSVPFYSQLAAFGPPTASVTSSDAVIVDRRLVGSADAFCLRVTDDGMATRGIRRDATILVNPDDLPLDGDLVAVRVGHDAVVRIVEQRGSDVVLVAGSAELEPIHVPAGDDQIVLGIVSGVFCRMLHIDSGMSDNDVAA